MKAIYFLITCHFLAMLAVFMIICSGCKVSDVGSSQSSNVATVDNSTDNSQTGISKCGVGSSFRCDPQTFTQTEECVNVDGTPVILNGPNPIDPSLIAACPTPTPTPEPAPPVV